MKTEPVYAVRSGTVLVAKTNKDSPNPYGNRVYITDEDGYNTLYAHLDSFSVKTGQRVEARQQIGIMGNTGTEVDHLHFGLFPPGASCIPANAIDPAPYVATFGMPCKHTAMSPFGSKVHHSSLAAHEGIDFLADPDSATGTLDGLQADEEYWRRSKR